LRIIWPNLFARYLAYRCHFHIRPITRLFGPPLSTSSLLVARFSRSILNSTVNSEDSDANRFSLCWDRKNGPLVGQTSFGFFGARILFQIFRQRRYGPSQVLRHLRECNGAPHRLGLVGRPVSITTPFRNSGIFEQKRLAEENKRTSLAASFLSPPNILHLNGRPRTPAPPKSPIKGKRQDELPVY